MAILLNIYLMHISFVKKKSYSNWLYCSHMGCFYHGIMISGPFERVISPLRTHTNSGD